MEKKANQHRMFTVNGLCVTGTKEQIQKYASDTKAFDYVKYTLERITKNNANQNSIRFGRIANCKSIVTVNKPGNNNKPMVMMYDAKTQEIATTVSIDELEVLKNERVQERIVDQLNTDRQNLVSDDVEKNVWNIHKKYNTAPKQKPVFKEPSSVIIEDNTCEDDISYCYG